MKSRMGMSLVEVIVALAILGILGAAVSAGLMSNLNLRRVNQQRMGAQQYISEIIELHKDYWSVAEKYKGSTVPYSTAFTQLAQRRPSFIENLAVSYSCLSSNGTTLGTGGPLGCSVSNPDLRRITIQATDHQGNVLARLTTEIGRPY